MLGGELAVLQAPRVNGRDIKLDCEFDAGICLYDVIGSFSDDESNQRILSNLAQQLKSGSHFARYT
jgi:hypothetical protein